MGKIHTRSYAQIPAHVYTSRWTDKIVQPMDIQQKSISLKDILGKDTDLSNSGIYHNLVYIYIYTNTFQF